MSGKSGGLPLGLFTFRSGGYIALQNDYWLHNKLNIDFLPAERKNTKLD